MRTTASILHADADAFFASVEQRDDPRLRGRPVLVGPGVVMAASYEARKHGVRGAMPVAVALRLCPAAVVVRPRFEAYVEASRRLFAIFEETAPAVEGISLEEAFLDVGGLERLAGSPEQIAARLRARVREEVGLAVTVGVARTKSLAKVASAVSKPDGLRVVSPRDEEAFLHPLPVECLWGVGKRTAAKLRGEGIERIGDLAALSEPALGAMLGAAAARHLHALARCHDPRPVRRRRSRRSCGSQSALRRTRDAAGLERALAGICDRVCRRLRSKRLQGRTVVLGLRFGDYSRVTRSRTLVRPTATTAVVFEIAGSLLARERHSIARRGVTLLRVALTNLDSTRLGVQLELPLAAGRAPETLDAALDEIRARFGVGAVRRAALPADSRLAAPNLVDTAEAVRPLRGPRGRSRRDR